MLVPCKILHHLILGVTQLLCFLHFEDQEKQVEDQESKWIDFLSQQEVNSTPK